jgi:hypothetical protein
MLIGVAYLCGYTVVHKVKRPDTAHKKKRFKSFKYIYIYIDFTYKGYKKNISPHAIKNDTRKL